MRLGEFILRDMERILRAWQTHAAGLRAARHPPLPQRRNHERDVLLAIVADLERPATPGRGTQEPAGLALRATGAPATAAQAHAMLRAESGFTIDQLASEYRALRTDVLSGWMEACSPRPPRVVDVVRFNESIDQALAESIGLFSAHVTRSRNLLLGMLSHDLRSPLQTIQQTARALQRYHANADVDHAAELLVRSGARMQKLLNDQVDFNRIELGLGIGVSPRPVDLGAVCAEELEQIRAAYAERPLELEVTGDCRGAWDAGRIQQLLNNLVVNAVHYGEPEEAIHVALRGSATGVCLTVANAGEAIDGETLAYIFEPMRRGKGGASRHDSGLGLGLYIASEIAKAHGGTIAADSRGRRTVFTVSLPKGAPA